MTEKAGLRSVPLFAALGEADLERIRAATVVRTIPAGERLFEQGDEGRHAYVIVSGEIEILKPSSHRDILLAVRGPGDVIGEMALLERAPRMACASARTETVLLEIPGAVLEGVLATSPEAVRGLFGVLIDRWRETEARMRQREQLAQLGTLSAGMAHELNNPAAAAERAAAGFAAAAERLAAAVAALEHLDKDGEPTARMEEIVGAGRQRLEPMARSDRQEELLDRLRRIDAAASLQWAPTLADLHGATIDAALDALDAVNPVVGAAAIETAIARLEVEALSTAALDATKRIGAIVGAIRSYAFTGGSPVQEVDLAQMLDDTLVLMAHRLGAIEISREYGDVPRFTAHGSELNQVWTNLIANAVDAVVEAGRDPGRIALRTLVKDGFAVVEVEDDGAGIPPEVLPRVFDSFFTTKPPGSGTGLGLDISYGIVVHRHGGEIDIDSEVGRTTVTVRLPMAGAG